MTYEEKATEAREFVSMILSCQLSVEFNKARPNKALRHTLKCIYNRITSEKIKAICKQGAESVYPLGWLAKQVNSISRMLSGSVEELTRISASL